MKPRELKHLISKPLATFWLLALALALGLQLWAPQQEEVSATGGEETSTELILAATTPSQSPNHVPEFKIQQPWIPSYQVVLHFLGTITRQPGFLFHPLQRWELKRLLMSTISINAP